MTYEKPEVRLLGEAGTVIMSDKPGRMANDGPEEWTNHPAYELDE
jgi:hypothetical protein